MSKLLKEFHLPPGREDGGWGLAVPSIVFLASKDEDGWDGPNLKIENNSTKALRIVVYDCTEEWRAEQANAAEEAERQKLAELKAKYEPAA